MVKRLVPLLLMIGVMCLVGGCVASQEYPTPEDAAVAAQKEFFDKGMEDFRQRRWPQAARNFQEAASRNPNHVEAWYHLALALDEQDMALEAEDAARQAAAVNPGYLSAREFLGLSLLSHDDPSGAKLELEAARSLDSGNPEVYAALGEIYLADTLCPDALDAFQRAVELDSGSSRAKEGLIKAAAACGGASNAEKENQGATPQSTNPAMKSGAMSIEPSDF